MSVVSKIRDWYLDSKDAIAVRRANRAIDRPPVSRRQRVVNATNRGLAALVGVTGAAAWALIGQHAVGGEEQASKARSAMVQDLQEMDVRSPLSADGLRHNATEVRDTAGDVANHYVLGFRAGAPIATADEKLPYSGNAAAVTAAAILAAAALSGSKIVAERTETARHQLQLRRISWLLSADAGAIPLRIEMLADPKTGKETGVVHVENNTRGAWNDVIIGMQGEVSERFFDDYPLGHPLRSGVTDTINVPGDTAAEIQSKFGSLTVRVGDMNVNFGVEHGNVTHLIGAAPVWETGLSQN